MSIAASDGDDDDAKDFSEQAVVVVVTPDDDGGCFVVLTSDVAPVDNDGADDCNFGLDLERVKCLMLFLFLSLCLSTLLFFLLLC